VEVRLRANGSPTFTDVVGRATGSTKKRAEQDAARQVLEHLDSSPAEVTKTASKGSARAQH
jgi:dsRNA-specific ribonuclease